TFAGERKFDRNFQIPLPTPRQRICPLLLHVLPLVSLSVRTAEFVCNGVQGEQGCKTTARPKIFRLDPLPAGPRSSALQAMGDRLPRGSQTHSSASQGIHAGVASKTAHRNA